MYFYIALALLLIFGLLLIFNKFVSSSSSEYDYETDDKVLYPAKNEDQPIIIVSLTTSPRRIKMIQHLQNTTTRVNSAAMIQTYIPTVPGIITNRNKNARPPASSFKEPP